MTAQKDDALIDQAINAAAQAGPVMIGAGGAFMATGRPFKIIVPEDITDAEIVDLMGFVATDLRAGAARARSGRRGKVLLVPR